MRGKQLKGVGTHTFLAVKHIAQVLVGLRVLADEGEYPFIRLVVCTEGYPVQLAVILHVLNPEKNSC